MTVGYAILIPLFDAATAFPVVTIVLVLLSLYGAVAGSGHVRGLSRYFLAIVVAGVVGWVLLAKAEQAENERVWKEMQAKEAAEAQADAAAHARCNGRTVTAEEFLQLDDAALAQRGARTATWTDHEGATHECEWVAQERERAAREQAKQAAIDQAARQYDAKVQAQQQAKFREGFLTTAFTWCDGWHAGAGPHFQTRAQCAECLWNRWQAEPLKDTYRSAETASGWWQSGERSCH